MKILLVAGQFYPDLAGSGIATYTVAKYLTERGHQVTVCVDSENQFLKLVSKRPGFKLVPISNYKDFLTGRSSFQKSTQGLYDIIRVGDYDIIHVFSYLSMLLIAQLGSLLSCPVVFTFWNAPNPGRRAIGFYKNSELDLGLAEHIIRHCPYDVMVLGSRVSYESAIDLGANPEKTSFCYHGIDVHSFRKGLSSNKDVIQEYFGYKGRSKTILLPGRITKRKGVFEAVRAMPAICSNSDVKLLLTRADDGADDGTVDRVKKLAVSLGIDNKILLSSGMIKMQDMPRLYKQASVVIVPSYYEGLGFTAIESLMAGRPVVMTRVPGLDEVGIHGHNCLMVSPSDSEALAAAVLNLLNNPSLAKELATNAERSVNKFNMELFVDYVERQYKELIGSDV